MKVKLLAIFIFLILFLAACSNSSMSEMDHGNMDMEEENNSEGKENDEGLQTTNTIETLIGNEINIVAQESKHQLNKSVSVNALTFNGSVPGSQIRVKQGEKVKINLKNDLNEPVSIHWHGITVPNEMDGIPGVTQNAVQPGKTFTYEFTPEDPGTYMYHTHQNAVEQMDKGLYGSFIAEPKEKTYDREYTLMLDEWMSKPAEGESSMEGMDHSNMGSEEDNNKESDSEESSMGGMDHGSMDGMGKIGHDMSAYDIFSINGKSGDSIEPLKVKEGERVRIRLVNVGFMSHKIHLHGHDFKVAAIDGQELNEPKEMKDQVISIAPGERYDIVYSRQPWRMVY